MSWANLVESITAKAAADLSASKFKVVELDANGDVTVAANTQSAFGILQNQPKSGEAATVAIEGFSRALAAVAVTVGQFVKNSSGWVTPVGSAGNAATYVLVGRAMTTAASGGLVTVRLMNQLVVNSGSALA